MIIPNYTTDTVYYPPAPAAPPRKPECRRFFIIRKIPIERGIPMPDRTANVQRIDYSRRPQYPWEQMEIGDSFVFPEKSTSLHTQRLASSNIGYRHYMSPKRYQMRSMMEDDKLIVRIWRVA